MMEEESKKPRPGKGKNKAGESEAVSGCGVDVAPVVDLDQLQHQVRQQRC